MDDAQRMGGLHRVEHLREEIDAPAHAQTVRFAPAVDALALHQFQHQIGLALGRDAGVEQLRNARVLQPRQDGALTAKAFLRAAVEKAALEQLDGGFALEAAVSALCAPDGAHAAFADAFDQRPRAQRIAGLHTGRQQRLFGHAAQKGHVAGAFARGQQLTQVSGRAPVVGGQFVQVLRAAQRRQREQFVQVR